MPIVQTASGSGVGVTSFTVTPGAATGAGHLLVLVTNCGGKGTTVTDTGGNTWATAQGTSVLAKIWYVAAGASLTSVTVALSASGDGAAFLYEISGALASPLDVSAAANATSTSWSVTASGPTAQADEIVVVGVGMGSNHTLGLTTAGYAQPSGSPVGETGNSTLAASGTLSAITTPSVAGTVAASAAWHAALASFKVSAAAPARVVAPWRASPVPIIRASVW